MRFGLDQRPDGTERRELDERQAVVQRVHGRRRARTLRRFVPRVLVREHANLFERLTIGARAVEEHAHRRQVVRDVELGVGELRHARALGHRAVGPELHADDVLDAHHLAAAHADGLGKIPYVLADAHAGDLVGGKAVVVLREHRVVRPLGEAARRTGRRRRGGRGTASALRDHRRGREKNGNG